MWKQVGCFVAVLLVSSILNAGCSASEEDMTSLLGIDANNDGVRDDVEA